VVVLRSTWIFQCFCLSPLKKDVDRERKYYHIVTHLWCSHGILHSGSESSYGRRWYRVWPETVSCRAGDDVLYGRRWLLTQIRLMAFSRTCTLIYISLWALLDRTEWSFSTISTIITLNIEGCSSKALNHPPNKIFRRRASAQIGRRYFNCAVASPMAGSDWPHDLACTLLSLADTWDQ